MHWTMAGKTVGRVRIACRSCLSVNALPELLHFVGVALGALGRRDLGSGSDFMVISMARNTGAVSECAVHARGHMRSLVRVTSRTEDLRPLGRVRIIRLLIIPDGRVAINAIQDPVNA